MAIKGLHAYTHLLAQRHAAAQDQSQSNHLGHQGLESQIVLERNPT